VGNGFELPKPTSPDWPHVKREIRKLHTYHGGFNGGEWTSGGLAGIKGRTATVAG